MPKQAKPATAKNQVEKFREAARAHECDEDEGHFDATLKRVAKAPPPKDDKPAPKKPAR